MTTYNTLNPVPSADARDRYDNSQVFDEYVTGTGLATPDRIGISRKTWAGLENDVNLFIQNSAFELPPLVYVDGNPLLVDRSTQLIERMGFLYSVKLPKTFPYTLTGTWATDEPFLTVRNDQSLRQDLADPAQGARMSAYENRTVWDALSERKSVLDFLPESEHAAIISGTSTYDATAGLQAAIDWAALNGKLIWLPRGSYWYSKLYMKAGFPGWFGEGQFKTRLRHISGSSTGPTILYDGIRINNPNFFGFSVEGSGDAQEEAGWDVTGFNYGHWESVEIIGFYGSNLRATGYLQGVDSSASTIVNTFVHCKFGVSVTGSGVELYAPVVAYTTASLIGWRMVSCYCNNNIGPQIKARFGEDIHFEGLLEGSSLLLDLDACRYFNFEGYTESLTVGAGFKLGATAIGYSIIVTRFTYPLWSLVTADSTIGKGRIEFKYAPPARSCTDNGDLSNLDSAGLPVGMTPIGGVTINQTIAEANSVKGAVMSVSIPVNASSVGFDLRLKGPASNYFGRRVTLRMRHRSSGVSGLNLLIFPRLAATNNAANGMYYTRSYLNPVGFVDTFADIVFADTSASISDIASLRFLWSKAGATSTAGNILIDELDVYEGGFGYPVGNSSALNKTSFSVSATATLSNSASWINILNKYPGKSVLDRSSGISYISQGSTPSSNWVALTNGATITPA